MCQLCPAASSKALALLSFCLVSLLDGGGDDELRSSAAFDALCEIILHLSGRADASLFSAVLRQLLRLRGQQQYDEGRLHDHGHAWLQVLPPVQRLCLNVIVHLCEHELANLSVALAVLREHSRALTAYSATFDLALWITFDHAHGRGPSRGHGHDHGIEGERVAALSIASVLSMESVTLNDLKLSAPLRNSVASVLLKAEFEVARRADFCETSVAAFPFRDPAEMIAHLVVQVPWHTSLLFPSPS